jgi:phage gp29-like protein
LAGGVHGVGLRSRIYWVYQIRQEILGWIVDALQRISTNGLLVGYYPTGNEQAQEAVAKALTDLIAKSVTTFPRDPGGENTSGIEAIAPSTVSYDTLISVLKYFDDIIESLIVGQSLSSGTESTGMGSEVANLHALTLERIIRYDANALSETLSKDLIQPLIRYNFGELPFQVKLKLQVEKTNVKDQMVAAKALFDMGVSMDEESLRDMAGFIAPRDKEQSIHKDETNDLRVGDSDKVGDTTTKTALPDMED